MSGVFIEGLGTTIVGMLAVFSILAILCGVLYLLRFVNPDERKKADNIKPAEIKPIEVKKEEPVIENKTDNTELVAVITATIAATLGTSSDKLQIKSINKVKNWNNTARREQQRNTI